MKKPIEEAAVSLEELGFTALESRIYVELLRSGALSGYRVAQLVGKAAANAYKALESLEARGAVVSEDGVSRLYRAVPFAEIVSMLSREFTERAQRATKAFSVVERETSDDRIYRLSRAEQVYERGRTLIERARTLVLVDAFPAAFDQVRDALEAAHARGVRVIVRAYASIELRGPVVVVVPSGEEIRARWPGTWLNLVSDGNAMMVALVAPDGSSATGMSSENQYLTWTYYSSLAGEIALGHLAALAEREPQLFLAQALRDVQRLLPQNLSGREHLLAHTAPTKKKRGTTP